MTAPSGGTTTDAARYKVGARLRVSFEGVVDKDGDFKATGGTYSYVGTPTHEPATPADLVELYGALLQATEGCSTAPAPYTEPREGDRVLIEREPVEGVVAFIGDEPYCHGGDRTAYVDCVSFAAAAAEGRVRLVKAAAPTYEPGRWYHEDGRPKHRWLHTGYELTPWLYGGRADGVLVPMQAPFTPPSDLVPCDVAEAT